MNSAESTNWGTLISQDVIRQCIVLKVIEKDISHDNSWLGIKILLWDLLSF